MESFSGNGEDLILKQYIFKKKKDGFYVDIGAFHPKHISNTHFLYKRVWKGINVDPNPETMNLFKKQRPQDVNLLCGVAKEEKPLKYYSFSHSGINTFSKEHAEHKESKSWSTLLETKDVMCYPLSKIFNEYLPEGQNIDLLDVDVEGIDLEVLESNDWEKYKPSVILVEDREFRDKLSNSKTYSYLENQGYKLHSYADITLIMTLKGFKVS